MPYDYSSRAAAALTVLVFAWAIGPPAAGDQPFFGIRTFDTVLDPAGFELADLDGDGVLDLVVFGGGHATHKGLGGGKFAAPVPIDAPRGFAALLEINGDAAPDLVVASNASEPGMQGLRTFLGDGDGTFSPQQTVLDEGRFVAVRTADLDGDGLDDIVALRTGGEGGVVTLLADGSGGFQLAQTLSAGLGSVTGTDGEPLVLADINHNGRPDIIALLDNSHVAVYLNDGAGTMLEPPTLITSLTPLQHAAAGDVTGDGMADLVLTNRVSATAFLTEGDGDAEGVGIGSHTQPTVFVLPGDGSGGFGPIQPVQIAELSAITDSTIRRMPVRLYDLSGDGAMEIVTLNPSATLPSEGSSLPPSLPSAEFVALHHQGETGEFMIEPLGPTAFTPRAFEVDDLDGDGRFDILSALPGPDPAPTRVIQIQFGREDGAISGPGSLTALSPAMHAIQSHDADGDGAPDVIFASFSTLMVVSSQDGFADAPIPLTFASAILTTPMPTVTSPLPGGVLEIADFTGDGLDDYLVGNMFSGSFFHFIAGSDVIDPAVGPTPSEIMLTSTRLKLPISTRMASPTGP